MDAWSNIEVLQGDPEIIEIDAFEKSLRDIPANVRVVRELITRFEVCHFKYRQHLNYIKNAIRELKTQVKTERIGDKHISKGENVWRKDNTGRSLIGHHYLTALNKWLGNISRHSESDINNAELTHQVISWLGIKNPEKERLVRLLIARLTWDWKLYEEYQKGGKYRELEYQICRMDICHYAFPSNLDSVVSAIGKMEPTRSFEGCGTYNLEIKDYISGQFFELNNFHPKERNKEEQIKKWLTACLAKTLKEQVGLDVKISQQLLH